MNNFEQVENSKIIGDLTKAIIELDKDKVKITPINLALKTKLKVRDIENNFTEIISIMDSLEIE